MFIFKMWYFKVVYVSLKRFFIKFLIFEKLRFRNGYIILMLIVKNRIILYRYEIWKLMSK